MKKYSKLLCMQSVNALHVEMLNEKLLIKRVDVIPDDKHMFLFCKNGCQDSHYKGISSALGGTLYILAQF